MIFFVGGDGGLVVFLVMLGLFVVLPMLFLRSAGRAVVVHGGGWQSGGGPPAPPSGGWELPREPALPPVAPADVVSLRDRLGHDVRTLDPGDDAVSRQAMADASERLGTCSALLERADTQAQLRTAWLAAVEGLTATRLVRTRRGLDPGPEIALPPTGPALRSPTRIDVGGRTSVGGPGYEPGRPHWFPGGGYGGRYVPAGWYDAPFWPSALVLGGLGGFALGGLAAGTMFADDGLYPGFTGGDDGGFGSGWDDGGGSSWGDGGGWSDSSGSGWDDSGGRGWGDGGGWSDSSGGGWGDSGGGWGDGGGGDFGGGDFGGGD